MVKNKGEISIKFYVFLLISRSGPGVCNEKGRDANLRHWTDVLLDAVCARCHKNRVKRGTLMYFRAKRR